LSPLIASADIIIVGMEGVVNMAGTEFPALIMLMDLPTAQ